MADATGSVSLTERELSILRLVAEGKRDKEIAAQLVLAPETVKWYNKRIYRKLEVRNRTEAVWEARARGWLAPLVATATSTLSALPTLPPTPPAFVGRGQDRGTLKALVVPGSLVTITGPGGTGKTSLALAVAHDVLDGDEGVPFAAGVCFVSLEHVESHAQMAAAIATALQFPLDGGAKGQTLEERLRAYLHDQRLLLILDNAEHLVPMPDWIVTLLHGGPQTSLLLTSRERLNLNGEQLFPLRGLPYPESVGPDTLSYPAPACFVAAARRARPGYEPGTSDFPALLALCRAVDGLPLALELAAGWLDVMPLGAIAREVQRDASLLASGASDVPARHRTVWAAFEGSWQRLGDAERTMFACLSLFRTPFSRQDARAVCAPQNPPRTVWAQLASLRARSLLRYDPDADRFDLHPLLRQYAAAQLDAAGTVASAAGDRHACTFTRTLQRQGAALDGANQRAAMAALTACAGDAQAAWRWAVDHGLWPEVSRAAAGLGRFLQYRGDTRTGADLFTRAVDAATARDEPHITAILPGLLGWQAFFLQATGDVDGAAGALASQRDLPATGEDGAFAHWVASRIAFSRGDLGEARRELHAARKQYSALDDATGAGRAMFELGTAAYRDARLDDAQCWLQRSLGAFRQVGNIWGIASSLSMLAWGADAAGRRAEAWALFSEALALNQEMGFEENALHNLAGLNWILLTVGRFADASELASEQVRLARRLGNHSTLARAYEAACLAALHVGNYQDALAAGEQSVTFAQASGYESRLGRVTLSLSQARLAAQQPDTAGVLAETALGICRRYPGHVERVVQAHVVLARARLAQGQDAAAWDHAHAALALCDNAVRGAPGYALAAAASLLAATGNDKAAATHYRAATALPMVAHSRWFKDLFHPERTALVRAGSAPRAARAHALRAAAAPVRRRATSLGRRAALPRAPLTVRGE